MFNRKNKISHFNIVERIINTFVTIYWIFVCLSNMYPLNFECHKKFIFKRIKKYIFFRIYKVLCKQYIFCYCQVNFYGLIIKCSRLYYLNNCYLILLLGLKLYTWAKAQQIIAILQHYVLLMFLLIWQIM